MDSKLTYTSYLHLHEIHQIVSKFRQQIIFMQKVIINASRLFHLPGHPFKCKTSVMSAVTYGSVYGPAECCDNVYMVELFYVDKSRSFLSFKFSLLCVMACIYCAGSISDLRYSFFNRHCSSTKRNVCVIHTYLLKEQRSKP